MGQAKLGGDCAKEPFQVFQTFPVLDYGFGVLLPHIFLARRNPAAHAW